MLHAPTMVGGNPVGLSRAERELGLDSVAVSLEDTPFRYEVDEVIWNAGDRAVAREWKRWRLILRAVREFDVVHFNFGSSLAPRRAAPEANAAYAAYARAFEFRDLALLRRAGKGIVVTYQGDDARQGDVSARFYDLSLADVPGYYSDDADAATRRGIAAFDRYADRIFALNPDLVSMLPHRAEFLPYSHIDPGAWEPRYGPGSDVPVVVHAPTHRAGKGTAHVLAAVEQLRSEGIELDLQLVEGLSHADARALYERADIAVDQLIAGWYGGFAVELMALGKPVVAFIRDEDLVHIPAAMRADLPVVSARPETVVDALRELVTMAPARRAELGRASRAYVQRWHDPRAIAAKLKLVYEELARG